MGISTEVMDDYTEVIVRDQVSPEELFSGFDRALSLNKENTGLPVAHGSNLLINVTESEVLPPISVIERVAGIIAHAHGGFTGRVAILVSQKVRYGRARQLGVFLAEHGITSEPFYVRDEALIWLKNKS